MAIEQLWTFVSYHFTNFVRLLMLLRSQNNAGVCTYFARYNLDNFQKQVNKQRTDFTKDFWVAIGLKVVEIKLPDAITTFSLSRNGANLKLETPECFKCFSISNLHKRRSRQSPHLCLMFGLRRKLSYLRTYVKPEVECYALRR